METLKAGRSPSTSVDGQLHSSFGQCTGLGIQGDVRWVLDAGHMNFVGPPLLPDPVMVEEWNTHCVLALVAIKHLDKGKEHLGAVFHPSGGAAAVQRQLFPGNSPEKSESIFNTKSKYKVQILYSP